MGYSPDEVAQLLDVCPRTVKDWLSLFQTKGLDSLCSLQYSGDSG
jgi:transposase